jgi:ubiquinone/menaquinone biosynthesis C-methylase UbiE
MHRHASPNDINRDVYLCPDVVDRYASASYLTQCEQTIFDEDVGPEKDILDLGVGGGRTAGFLGPKARKYVGTDRSINMVKTSHEKFPQLHFEVADAADLSQFADGSFDVVVFSFNGLGELYPHAKRLACHNEVHRVLRPRGLWVFSMHHAGSLLFRLPTSWRAALGAIRRSVPRFIERVRCKAFWNGLDYHHTSTHGGILVLLARRSRVVDEVKRCGFDVVRILGDDYPQSNIPLMTRWYYYVCRKR